MSKRISTWSIRYVQTYVQTEGTADPKRHFSPEALKFIRTLSVRQRYHVLQYLWCNLISFDINNPDDTEILCFVANVSRNFYDKYVSNYDSTNELGYTKHYDLDFVSTCMLDKLIEMHKPCYYDYVKEHQHLPLRVKITPEINNFMVSLDIDNFTELIKWIDLTPIKDKSSDKPHEQFVSVSCGHIVTACGYSTGHTLLGLY